MIFICRPRCLEEVDYLRAKYFIRDLFLSVSTSGSTERYKSIFR